MNGSRHWPWKKLSKADREQRDKLEAYTERYVANRPWGSAALPRLTTGDFIGKPEAVVNFDERQGPIATFSSNDVARVAIAWISRQWEIVGNEARPVGWQVMQRMADRATSPHATRQSLRKAARTKPAFAPSVTIRYGRVVK